VLPEVIEQRKQGALKGPQMKLEVHGANGEEGLLVRCSAGLSFLSINSLVSAPVLAGQCIKH